MANRPSPTANAMWSGVGPGVATTRIGTSTAGIVAAVLDLDDRVRQVPAAAWTDQHLDAELLAERLRSRRVIGVGVGQRDRHDPTASGPCLLDGPVEGRTGRVARVDQHAPFPPDQVRLDRLACHAAAGRHLDPHDVVGDGLDDDLRRDAPGPTATGSPRST